MIYTGWLRRYTTQIRRLQYKRDSLQDIFMKAMEAGKK
jgi:hypothetical protein